jgi:plastocyanin
MKYFYKFLLGFVLLAATNAYAKNDTIYFGGEHGTSTYTYSEPTSPVNVGDIVVWVGPFAGHTLQSGSPVGGIPTGAAPFSKKDFSGTSFSYMVTVAGTYNFECTLHVTTNNMYSAFTAEAAGVEQPQQTTMVMDPVYPNPAMDEAMVHFTLENPAHVTLRIYNSIGTLVQTPTNEEMSSGFHMLMIDTKQLASGSYQYVLQAGDAVLARAMIVAK